MIEHCCVCSTLFIHSPLCLTRWIEVELLVLELSGLLSTAVQLVIYILYISSTGSAIIWLDSVSKHRIWFFRYRFFIVQDLKKKSRKNWIMKKGRDTALTWKSKWKSKNDQKANETFAALVSHIHYVVLFLQSILEFISYAKWWIHSTNPSPSPRPGAACRWCVARRSPANGQVSKTVAFSMKNSTQWLC